MGIEQRLSETFREFLDAVKAEGAAVAAAVLKALRESITPGAARKLDGGGTIASATVELSGVAAAAGPALKAEVKQLIKHVGEETARRGQAWAEEGLHLAIGDLLVKPLDEHVKANPAPAEDVERFRPSSSSPMGPFGGPPPSRDNGDQGQG